MSAGTHAAPASATSGAARFAGQTAIVTGAVGGIGSSSRACWPRARGSA